jgi:hypothetical protein
MHKLVFHTKPIESSEKTLILQNNARFFCDAIWKKKRTPLAYKLFELKSDWHGAANLGEPSFVDVRRYAGVGGLWCHILHGE